MTRQYFQPNLFVVQAVQSTEHESGSVAETIAAIRT